MFYSFPIGNIEISHKGCYHVSESLVFLFYMNFIRACISARELRHAHASTSGTISQTPLHFSSSILQHQQPYTPLVLYAPKASTSPKQYSQERTRWILTVRFISDSDVYFNVHTTNEVSCPGPGKLLATSRAAHCLTFLPSNTLIVVTSALKICKVYVYWYVCLFGDMFSFFLLFFSLYLISIIFWILSAPAQRFIFICENAYFKNSITILMRRGIFSSSSFSTKCLWHTLFDSSNAFSANYYLTSYDHCFYNWVWGVFGLDSFDAHL